MSQCNRNLANRDEYKRTTLIHSTNMLVISKVKIQGFAFFLLHECMLWVTWGMWEILVYGIIHYSVNP